MSRSTFYLWIFFLFPALFFLLKPVHVGDLSIWVALGRDSIDQLRFIRQDFYTITTTKLMVYPAGLCVLYGLLYKLGGLSLVIFLHALIPGCWALIWYHFIRNNKQNKVYDIWTWQVLMVFVIAMIGSTLVYTARPALVATIPLLLAYIILSRNRKDLLDQRSIALLAVLEIVWVNLHGSFLILPMILAWQSGPFLFRRQWDLLNNRLMTLLLLMGCVLVNPFGMQVISYTWETAVISKARELSEWLPPQRFLYPFASWYFFTFSAILFALIVRKIKSEKKWMELVFDPIVIVWASGFLAVRNTYLMFLLLPLFLFGSYELRSHARSPNSNSWLSRGINVAVIIGLFGTVIAMSPFFKQYFSDVLPNEFQASIDPRSRSEKIDAYLNANPGILFNEWSYGSDLALQQNNKYFIDIRNIIFSDRVNQDYDSFIASPEAGFSALEKYNFRYFLIDQKHEKLVSWLRSSTKFKELMTDGPAILFLSASQP